MTITRICSRSHSRARSRRAPLGAAGAAGIVATLAVAAAAPLAHADWAGVKFVPVDADLVDTPAGYQTWRVVARFTSDRDYVTAIAGWEVAPIRFHTDDPEGLLNLEDLEGCQFIEATKEEDFARSPNCPAWDSYVTIGFTSGIGNDTDYSDEFLSADGAHNVIEGRDFLEIGGEGWYDSNPGNIWLAGQAKEIVIAQFTVRQGFALDLCGYLYGSGPGGDFEGSFCADTTDPCEEDVNFDDTVDFNDVLAILAAWGPVPNCPPSIPEDVNEDCVVGFSDLVSVLADFGPCD